MKAKQLKKLLDKLTPEQLEQPILYLSDEYSISGQVPQIKKARQDFYFNGEDDPSKLLTKKEIVAMGEDPSEFQLEIPKGAIVVYLDVRESN